MYCMNCGKEIPEDGQFCPACGVDAPRKTPAQPAMPVYPPGYPAAYPPAYPQAYPPGYAPPDPYRQPYPAHPPAAPGYQAYPVQAPYPPQYYSPYGGYRPVVVVPMVSPLPKKPPMGQRVRERLDVYAQQARENRLETGLSVAAACMVVMGTLAMMVAGL